MKIAETTNPYFVRRMVVREIGSYVLANDGFPFLAVFDETNKKWEFYSTATDALAHLPSGDWRSLILSREMPPNDCWIVWKFPADATDDEGIAARVYAFSEVFKSFANG